jgi:formylglycine-generating enzyme required for sulfatase activity
VALSEYSISKYPITNREYQDFVKKVGYNPPPGWDGDQYPIERGDHPVVRVSWDDVLEYCKWLSTETNKAYRLPTEAEWEKAASGPDGNIYPWGNEFDPKKCNTRILRHIIIKNNLFSQDKCLILFSPTQVVKKQITRVYCA